MSLADAGGPTAGLPDEGTIHEWLDGQLDDVSARALEQLVRASPEFAAQVAEARGLTAMASRILIALDDTPATNAPRTGDDRVASITSAPSMLTAPDTARRSYTAPTWRRWASAAALLMVGATGVYVVQRPSTESVTFTATTDSVPAGQMRVATEFPTAAEIQQLADAGAVRVRDAAPLGSGDVVSASAAPTERATPMPSAARANLEPETGVTAGAVRGAAAVERLNNASERVSSADAPSGAISARSFSESSAPAALLSVSSSRVFPDTERAFAVQRVQCTPTCVQERREVATDGRVAHVTLQPSSRDPRRGAVDANAVAALAALADSLQIGSLPAVLRLNAAACQSVGNLRESLRLEMRMGETLKVITALPWCASDEDPFNHFTRAVERTVERGLR